MGVLQRFERRLSGLVEGTFARVFGGYVQPVEVAAALTREAQDKKAIVGAGRVLVPNSYVVELGDADIDRLVEYDAPLRAELAAMVAEAATEQGWSFVGPVDVRLERTAGLGTGVFRVRSSVVAGPPTGDLPTPLAAGSAPDPAPPLAASAASAAPVATPAQPVVPVPVVPVPARLVPLVVPRRPPTPGPAAPVRGNPARDTPVRGNPARETPARETPAPAAIAGPHLVVLGHGPAAAEPARTIRLTGPVTVIGRGADADVQLTDTGVSRRHAEVRLTGIPALVDLGSTNGTRLNSLPVAHATLRDGDRIGVGTSELVFRTGDPA